MSFNNSKEIMEYFLDLSDDALSAHMELCDVYEDGRFTSSHVKDFIINMMSVEDYQRISRNHLSIMDYCEKNGDWIHNLVPLRNVEAIVQKFKVFGIEQSFKDIFENLMQLASGSWKSEPYTYIAQDEYGFTIKLLITNSSGESYPRECDYLACLYFNNESKPRYILSDSSQADY